MTEEELKNQLGKIAAETEQIKQTLEALKSTLLEQQTKIDNIKLSTEQLLSNDPTAASKHPLEVEKLDEEIKKLRKENLEPKWAFTARPFLQGVGFIAVIGTLIGAVVTGSVQTCSYVRQQEEKREIEFRNITDGLADNNPAKRIVAAVKIARFLEPEDEKFQPETISVLSKSLFFEKDYLVAETIGHSMLKLPKKAGPEFTSVKRELNATLPSKYSERDPNRGSVISLIHRKLLLAATLEQKALGGSINLSRSALGNRAWLHCAKLPEEKLKNADFSEAELWQADLYAIDFEGATLREVNFKQSNLTKGVFRGADLKDAHFLGARLWSTDFRGAKNLNVKMFEDASWASARFDPGFGEQIRRKFPNSAGKDDQREGGKEQCRKLLSGE